ncbi:hypothetical protein OC835_004045, partial [Tilletia horrida]
MNDENSGSAARGGSVPVSSTRSRSPLRNLRCSPQRHASLRGNRPQPSPRTPSNRATKRLKLGAGPDKGHDDTGEEDALWDDKVGVRTTTTSGGHLQQPTPQERDAPALAPWVSSQVESNWKWLKYVPDGVIRTAQAAEWKMQAWRLGKQP